MKVFRGPSQKSFYDESHEQVASVSASALEAGIRSKAHITFNITKDGKQREAVCTAVFEDKDLVPVANGLLARLAMQQECLALIKTAINSDASDDDKLTTIGQALKKI